MVVVVVVVMMVVVTALLLLLLLGVAEERCPGAPLLVNGGRERGVARARRKGCQRCGQAGTGDKALVFVSAALLSVGACLYYRVLDSTRFYSILLDSTRKLRERERRERELGVVSWAPPPVQSRQRLDDSPPVCRVGDPKVLDEILVVHLHEH